MLVKLRICDEMASNVCGVRARAVEPLVILVNGASVSTRFRILCNASIVAEGGVFSPSMGRLRWLGVDLPVGVGVCDPSLVGLRSGDLLLDSSYSDNFDARRPLSGDLLSNESLNPLTELPCTDCMRL